MFHLELNEKELETLVEVIESFLSELRTEVSHTDRLAYREKLRDQEHMIRGIQNKLAHLRS